MTSPGELGIEGFSPALAPRSPTSEIVMSSFHPENLHLSTLKGWAKKLCAAAPETLGRPIALNQAQALIAKALSYPDWHTAATTLSRELPQPGPLNQILVSRPEENTSTAVQVFHLFALATHMNVPARDVLAELDQLSLPGPMRAPMRAAEAAMNQSLLCFIDFLTDLYAREDRIQAMEFHQLAVLQDLPAALRNITRHLPALFSSDDPQKSVAGVPIADFLSWMRRLSFGLESNVATESMLRYFQKEAPGGLEAPAAERKLTTDARAALAAEQTLGPFLARLADRINPSDPGLSLGLKTVGVFGGRASSMSVGLKALAQQDW
jgi:hypothetical protein